jgi:hypothetical protein
MLTIEQVIQVVALIVAHNVIVILLRRRGLNTKD